MSSYPPPPPPPPPPFLSQQPPPPVSNLSSKILTFAAIGMGIGFGTCSIAALASGGNKFGQSFIAIGAGTFFISLAVLTVTGLFVIISLLAQSFKK